MEASELTTWNIVCLDPSTDWTGAVLLEYREDGAATLLEMTAISGLSPRTNEPAFASSHTDLRALVNKMDRTSYWLTGQLRIWQEDGRSWDTVAFEDVMMFKGGTAKVSQALIGATFRYLTNPHFRGASLMPILRIQACDATGTRSVYMEPAGKTDAEKKAKKARLKSAVQAAVCQRFSLSFPSGAYLPEEVEAICDAAAVGLAAGKKLVEELRAERAKTAQKVMRIGGSRGPAKRAKVAA
jgi:hypothetical protein